MLPPWQLFAQLCRSVVYHATLSDPLVFVRAE